MRSFLIGLFLGVAVSLWGLYLAVDQDLTVVVIKSGSKQDTHLKVEATNYFVIHDDVLPAGALRVVARQIHSDSALVVSCTDANGSRSLEGQYLWGYATLAVIEVSSCAAATRTLFRFP